MSISVVTALPEKNWRAFVDEHPQGNIFHTPEMFRVYARTKGYYPELWAAVSEDEVLALLVPVRISLTGGALGSLMSRAVSFGSLLYSSGTAGAEAVRELLHQYVRRVDGSVLFTELRNVSDLQDIQDVLGAHGFAFSNHLNYLINLDPFRDNVWQGLSHTIRKHIRTAQERHLELNEMTDPRQIAVAYGFLRKAYKRIAIPLPDLTLFEAAFEVLGPKGMLKAYLIQHDGIPISARLVLAYKDRIIDWFTGSDRAYRKLFPEEFAIWSILQWGRSSGYRLFDFGGAGRPEKYYGPRIFKARFGGTLVNYGRNTFVHAPLRLKLGKLGFALFRWFL